MKVYLEVMDGAVIPDYAHLTDAGMDVYANAEVHIGPGETKLVPLGLKLAIPDGYEIQVRPRSGLSLNTPLRIANAPGTVDAGYRGEACVIVTNLSCEAIQYSEEYTIAEKGNKKGPYVIKPGDKIAQIVLNKIERIEFEIVGSVSEIGEDRGGGFGSTGTSHR